MFEYIFVTTIVTLLTVVFVILIAAVIFQDYIDIDLPSTDLNMNDEELITFMTILSCMSIIHMH